MPAPITGMTIREASERWGVSTQRIYQWRAQRRIRCTFSASGELLILTKDRPLSKGKGGRPARFIPGERDE